MVGEVIMNHSSAVAACDALATECNEGGTKTTKAKRTTQMSRSICLLLWNLSSPVENVGPESEPLDAGTLARVAGGSKNFK